MKTHTPSFYLTGLVLSVVLLIGDPVVFYAADTLVTANGPQVTASITAADAQVLLNNQEAQISAQNDLLNMAATQTTNALTYSQTNYHNGMDYTIDVDWDGSDIAHIRETPNTPSSFRYYSDNTDLKTGVITRQSRAGIFTYTPGNPDYAGVLQQNIDILNRAINLYTTSASDKQMLIDLRVRVVGLIAGTPEHLMLTIQNNTVIRNSFNRLFGTVIPATGSISSAAKQIIYDLASGLYFEETQFLTTLTKANTVLINLRKSTDALNAFNYLFRTSLALTGVPAAADRARLFGLTGDPNFNPAAFLVVLPKAKTLLSTLQGNAQYAAAFDQVFHTSVINRYGLSDATLMVIFDVAGGPSYDLTNLISNTQNAYTILSAVMSASAADRDAFNLFWGTAITQYGSGPNDTAILMELGALPVVIYAGPGIAQRCMRPAMLYRNFQSSALNRANFNQLFGTTLISSGPPSVSDRNSVFAATDGSLYGLDQAIFLAALTDAASLHRSLQANAQLLINFNAIFGDSLVAAGTPNDLGRTCLFRTVRVPGYDKTVFIPVLVKAGALLRALKNSPVNLVPFNSLFGARIDVAVTPNVDDQRILFDLVGSPSFVLSSFLPVMRSAGTLLTTMRQNNGTTFDLNRFNWLFGTTLNATATPSPYSLSTLFGVAGDPNFNMGAFLPVLRKTDSLLTAIRQQGLTGKFNTQFDAHLLSTITAPTPADRGLLFNITGDPNFNQVDFIAWLKLGY